MQDSPGLDVRNDSLDLVPDLVDGPVVGPVVWVKRQVRGFSPRGDHAQSDVSLVADVPGRRGSVWEVSGGYVEQAAAAQDLGVVRAPVLGGRRPRPGSLTGCRPPGRSAPWSCAYRSTARDGPSRTGTEAGCRR